MERVSKIRRVAVAAAPLLAIALAATDAAAGPNCTRGNAVTRGGRVKRLDIVGLTSAARLVCFTDRAPDTAVDIGPVSGLGSPDAALVGIDFRVQDGLLYGLGDGGGVYTVDPGTGVATLVNRLTEPLRPATEYDIDFNPTANRLRIVGNTGQNLRHDVVGGTTIADADLNVTAGMTYMGIAGAAYVNNDLAPSTATTLFDLDAALDRIVVQSPPNAGTLAATGNLGVDAIGPVGLDVFSAPVNGATDSNHAFASIVVPQGTGFYRVDLLTGVATLVRPFTLPVVDIAIPVAAAP